MHSCKLTQNLDSWEEILSDDFDKDFIFSGIENGFHVVDQTDIVQNVHCKNYKSILEDSVKDIAEDQIRHEIDVQNYIVCSSQPQIVSSLGAILKENGKVRLIHDCSRPDNVSVNSYASTSHFKYQTVDDVVEKLPKNGFMAKVDLSSAYRSVPLHPSCYQFMGLYWLFEGDTAPTYMVDTRLAFGLAKAPEIFQRISNSIVRYMKRQGFCVVCYLDDYLIIDADEKHCKEGYELLQDVLQRLGFDINVKKLEPPVQIITFLGIEIDSINSTLSLPGKKLEELSEELAKWQTKNKATKHELQQLIGKLNWGAKVIKGGRTFLRRLIDLMCTLKRKHHHVRLNSSAKADIQWWANYISIFNGTASFIDKPVPSSSFTTDACLRGGGGAYKADWFYSHWETDFPDVADLHINLKEIFTVFLASIRWAQSWQNQHIVVYSDNAATVFMINKGSSRNSIAMVWLRQLFWLSAVFNFHLTARHIKGKDNVISDVISRLDDFSIYEWVDFLSVHGLDMEVPKHISPRSMHFLLFQNQNGNHSNRNVLDTKKQHMPPQQKQPTARCGMHSYDFVSTSARPLCPRQERQC